MSILLDLFLTFAKIGLFTFGGGYAMISIIDQTCVEKKGWISHDDMMNITVIAESTPGPIAINCSTFVGYRQAGFWGALWATVGIVLPSFIIIYIISRFLDNFLEIAVVARAFRGIRIAVGLLILDAGFNMIRKMSKKTFPRIVTGCTCGIMLLAALLSRRISSIALMVTAGLISLVLFFLNRKGGAAQ